jgi:hypothetical protein
VPPLPENQELWQELQIYETTDEAGEGVEVIVYNGEAIELAPQLIGPEGEPLEGYYEWDEITSKLGFDYGIEVGAERKEVKMGAYFDAIVLDARNYDRISWLLVAMKDADGDLHKVLLVGGKYNRFLLQLDEDGSAEALINRGFMLNRDSEDVGDGGTEIDLTGFNRTPVTKAKILPGDRLGLLLELEGEANSSTFEQAGEEQGHSNYSSVQELALLLDEYRGVDNPLMGEKIGVVALGFFVSSERTQ